MIADEQFAATTLREARRRAQLSQQALAAAAGVAPSVLSAYETGARQPSAKMWARLVRAAGPELRIVEPQEQVLRQRPCSNRSSPWPPRCHSGRQGSSPTRPSVPSPPGELAAEKVDVPEVQRWLVDIVGPDDQRLGRLTDLLRLVQEPTKDVPVAAEIFGRRHSLGD